VLAARRASRSRRSSSRPWRNIYEKLGVSDRAAAVAEAMRRGLIR